QYLLASKKLPQAWHLHCIVITWLPNSEITSVSADRQNGHGGFSSLPRSRGRAGWGLSTRRHVALFGEALQHLERRLVDTARLDSPADRLPTVPLEPARRSLPVEPLFALPATNSDQSVHGRSRNGTFA